MKKSPITIREVSRLSGVSTATVSRVINHLGNVSEKTTRKVQEAIETLSYQKNPLASGLKSGHSKTIGVVMPHLDNRYFMCALDGIEAALSNAGYTLMLAATGNDVCKESQAISKMLAFKVDGLIVATSQTDGTTFERISKENCPVVLIDRRIPNAKVDTISEENFDASRALVRNLLDAGHRRFSIFTGNMQLGLTRERLQGACAAIREAGLTLPESHIIYCQNNIKNACTLTLKAFELWRAENNVPTAAIALNSNVAEGILLACRNADIRVPEDLSLVSFGLLRSELIQPRVTALAQDGFRVGRLAGEHILRRIKSKNEEMSPDVLNLVLHNKIETGDSIAPI